MQWMRAEVGCRVLLRSPCECGRRQLHSSEARRHGGSEELRRLVELRVACAVPEAVQRASVTPAGAKRWNSPWIRVSV